MKFQMKKIKDILATILTLGVMLLLFGLIFVRMGIVVPNESFFLELSIVILLTLMMKIWWYDYAEDKCLTDDEMKQAKQHYFDLLDSKVTDTNDFEKYLIILNQENKDNYVKNKLGCRTPEKFAKKNWWICLWHPSYKKLSKQEIGAIRYNKLYFKILRKADKIKQITITQVMALSNSSELLYDAQNYQKRNKNIFHIATTILTTVFVTALAMMAVQELLLNWANAIRYIGYLCAMIWTIAYTILVGYRQTKDAVNDYYDRLKVIIDKYDNYKGGHSNGV